MRVLLSLGKLVATLWAAEAFFVLVVLGAVIVLVRIPLRRFVQAAREPFLIAFSRRLCCRRGTALIWMGRRCIWR